MTALLRESLKYVLVITLFIGALVAVNHQAYQRGTADALLSVAKQKNDDQNRGFAAFQAELKKQLTQAQQWNERFSLLLAERATIDEKTTQDLRDALKKTQMARRGCVLDVDVLQQLTNAHERAVTAARHGLASQPNTAVQRPRSPAQEP